MNGRHGGQVLHIEYNPTIKLPIQDKNQISMGEKEDKSVRIGDEITYKECFRAVDKKIVIYSVYGDSEELNRSDCIFQQTYPIRLF